MQYARDTRSTNQLGLFHNALMASRLGMTALPAAVEAHSDDVEFGYSEICLNGTPRQCLQWLAPVLRDLSQASAPGWLTLIDPPQPVSHSWLRAAGLDPWRILIVRPNRGMDSLALCCDILKLGCSHTVVSWLPADTRESRLLDDAAQAGHCRSLNVRLEVSRAA